MLEKETTLVELSLEDMSNVSGGGYYEGGPTVGVGGVPADQCSEFERVNGLCRGGFGVTVTVPF